MEGARDLAAAMAERGEGKLLDQFNNPDNPYAHYTTTGPEIWRQTDGRITHFVSSMGTTGTITGVSRFLREQAKPVSIIGLQPEEGSSIPGIRRWPQEYMPGILMPRWWMRCWISTSRMRKTRCASWPYRKDLLWRQFRRRGCRGAAYCSRQSGRGGGGDHLRSRRSLSLNRRVRRRTLQPGRVSKRAITAPMPLGGRLTKCVFRYQLIQKRP